MMEFHRIGDHGLREPVATARPASTLNDGRRDFDLIGGRSKVVSREREKSGHWSNLEFDYEGWTLMDGLANIDRMFGTGDGKYFEGVSVRTFDPVAREWTIYWTEVDHPVLKEQVRGRFDGNVGTFYRADKNARFVWRHETADKAHWELDRLLPDNQ
ncbi:MAG: hypothetical protein ACR2HH_10155 [Chthoniobacterales bacterium]